MKKHLKFLIIGLLSIILLLQSVTVFAVQQTTVSVEFSAEQVEQGDNFTATVKIGKLDGVAGIVCKLTYDKSKVKVSSTDIAGSEFLDALVDNKDAVSTVTYVWDSAQNESTNGGKLFAVNFQALSSAPIGNAAFSLTVTEMFTATYARIESTVTPNSGINIINKTIPQNVIETIALIDSIGTVDTKPETLDKINAALSAYSSLNNNEKELVTNYATLANAYSKYNELKAEEEAQKNIENNKKIIDDFKARPILKKTTKNIALSDEIAVLDALNYYDIQSTYIRSQLQEEAALLKSLKAKIAEIKDDVSAKEEATQQVKDFIGVYDNLLKIPVESIFLNNEIKTKLEAALMTFEMLNDYAKAELKDEIAHINAQLERYTELEILNAPESEVVIRAANEFKEKYRRILSLSESDVTEKDKAEINQAIDELKGFSNELKGKLINQLEKLNGLLFALTKPESTVSKPEDAVSKPEDTMSKPEDTVSKPESTVSKPESTIIEIPVGNDSGETQIVYVEKEAEEVEDTPLKIKHVGNKTLMILVIILAVSMLGLAASAVIYINIKRKELLLDGDIEQE